MRANSWEDAADLCRSLGVNLDPWQEEVLRAGLGERSNGDWAARQVACSAPRQNGKTEIIVARILAGLLLFGERLIMVSAHRQDTAREVFFRMVQLVENNPNLNERVDFIARSEMREFIRLKTGQEVRFKARSSGSGRGFSCDCLLLDEAQILSDAAWSAVLPTMSAKQNPQVWLFGTPPSVNDDGEVFGRLRAAGMAGKGSRLAYVEWSAGEDDDLDDPKTWAKANPAYGTRISREAVESERTAMDDERFAVERLGMWQAARVHTVLPPQSWDAQQDSGSVAVDRFSLGVEVGPDLGWASVALAGQRGDGGWHVELNEDQHTKGRGTAWVAPYLEAILAENPQVRCVVGDVGGPLAALLERRDNRWFFSGTRLELTPVKVSELGAGCARVLDGVVAGWLWHIGQPQLSAAALSAGKRPLGDTGMWVWNRKTADSDITPVQALTLALIGAQIEQPRRPKMVSNQFTGKVVAVR